MKKEINKIYQDDLDSFPDFQTYKSELKILDNFNFSKLSQREIYDIYFDYAKILPTSFGVFYPEKFNSHKFYRVRLKKTIAENEDLSIKQTYSFPPPNILKYNGRGNLKNKSVFYCSNDPNGAMIESKPNIGDEGFLSVWNGIAIRPIKIGICLPFDLPEENVWNLMAKDTLKHLIKNLPNETKNKYNHFMMLNKFIANKFVTEKEPYHLTSMISNELLYGELWRDFILYPSILAKTKLCNMAFHPNSVDENLRFDKVIKFKIVDLKNEVFKFKLGKVGHIVNNKMVWKNRTENENNLFKRE